MHVVILVALMPEARAIARAFHLPEKFSGRISTHENISIALIGPRARYLDTVRDIEPHAILMAGLAGALAPDLQVGDVVIQGNCPPLAQLTHAVRFGPLATSPAIVGTPAEKAALFRQSGALAVDMETQRAQEFAAALGLPFLAVRAISDSATDTLDPALLTFLDPEGRPRVGRVFMHLAGHPGKLTALLQIRRTSNLALSHLAATLVAIFRSGWPQNV